MHNSFALLANDGEMIPQKKVINVNSSSVKLTSEDAMVSINNIRIPDKKICDLSFIELLALTNNIYSSMTNKNTPFSGTLRKNTTQLKTIIGKIAKCYAETSKNEHALKIWKRTFFPHYHKSIYDSDSIAKHDSQGNTINRPANLTGVFSLLFSEIRVFPEFFVERKLKIGKSNDEINKIQTCMDEILNIMGDIVTVDDGENEYKTEDLLNLLSEAYEKANSARDFQKTKVQLEKKVNKKY